MPSVNADESASEAIKLADEDGDSQISKEEAVATPSLLDAFAKYDANGDGKLDAMEIETRIASWTARGAKVIPVSFYLKLDGQPLTEAKIVLEPEPFTGGALTPAEGMSASGGACGPTVAPEHLSKEVPVGVFYGLYRVKVTHPSMSIAVKYNESTELGMEVAPDYDFYSRKTFELSSK